jgi:hypothetical protein
MPVKARVKLPCGAVFTLDDEMRWSSDCQDTVGDLDAEIKFRFWPELPLRFTLDCRSMAEILNHHIEIGLAARGWGTNYIPDVGHAEAKRVAKIFGGEIIELTYGVSRER